MADFEDVDFDVSWLKEVEEDIYPAFREDVSSSTGALEKYLDSDVELNTCEEENTILNCKRGSNEIKNFLNTQTYSIGYLSRGHSYPENVAEAYLRYNGIVCVLSVVFVG